MDMLEKHQILFEAKKIRKVFGPTVAVDDVDLTIYAGEVRGLIGENGSGKSTISSIIAGMQKPNSGSMYFDGKSYNPANMIEGGQLGIGMIVQEKGTVSGITIAQNIFLGSENQFKKYGFINKKAMNQAARKVLENIGIDDVDPNQVIDVLDMQDQKLVEVAKVMHQDPQILIVDETTTALSHRGREIVYDILNRMRNEGKAVVFISHDLQETMDHCDALTVLRDGKLIATVKKEDMEENQIKQYMVGREVRGHYYRADNKASYEDQVILDIDQLTTGKGLLLNFSAQLHQGEILGIGGLSHCGMHELGRAVFGEEHIVTGSVTHVPSGEIIENAQVAVKHQMGYVSKNRDSEALVLTANIRDNIVGAGYDQVSQKLGYISPKKESEYVHRMVDALDIKCASIDQDVKYLSGGNKQKVVFGKWLGRESKILILDCPTRGVDIGVKAAMYRLMEDMKAKGASILLISEELTELIGMSDRMIIIKDGKIAGEITRGEEMTENNVIELLI
jgi:ribose transport system ATP-binding protein